MLTKIDWDRGTIVEDLLEADYRAVPALSGTEIKALAESPAQLQHNRETPWVPNRGAVLGSALDCLVFEGAAEFQDRYAVLPEGLHVTGMFDAVRAHPLYDELLGNAKHQVSLFWTESGVRCKGRVDALTDNYIVDLKSTGQFAGFARQARQLHYDWQAAHYTSGLLRITGRDLPWCWYVVQAEPIHHCETWVMGMSDFARADEEREDLLQRYAECEALGEWPSTSGRLRTIELPRW